MERINVSRQSILQYFFVASLVVLSSFEYFFRQSNLVIFLYVLAIFALAAYGIKRNDISRSDLSRFYLMCTIVVVSFQILVGVDRANYLVGMIITGIGSIAIAYLLKDNLIRTFTNVIFIISAYSLIIYLLCLVPSINEYLLSLTSDFLH